MVRKTIALVIKAGAAVALIAISHRAGHASHVMQSAQPASGWRVFNRYQFSAYGAVRDTVMYVITSIRAIPESIREFVDELNKAAAAEIAVEREQAS